LKKFIKKCLNWIIKIIISSFKKFNIGRYIIDQFIYNVSKIIIEIPNKNLNLKFYSPNRLNNFRINTFFTKEPETINWIDNFEKDTIFFDIGANIGLYSCYAAKKKNCRVFAFEPSVFNLELLAKNIYLNELSDQIVILPTPISNTNQISQFNMSNVEAGGALSTFGESYTHDGSKLINRFNYKTPGTSLDYLAKFFKLNKPKYLKIDVDGIEHLILEGADEILNETESILVEVNDKFKLQYEKIHKNLTSKGFEMVEKKQSQLIAESKEVHDVFNQIWARKNN
tara:strand:+ start:140 stop:991 length:852 start_codon:yes stop_codon:yes gene_type:complete